MRRQCHLSRSQRRHAANLNLRRSLERSIRTGDKDNLNRFVAGCCRNVELEAGLG